MNEVERLYRQLVYNLSATDPARLHSPIPLAEIRESILPYRASRRALQLETSEDYELALMRLCAGEGGFARIEPEEARSELVAEVQSQNPDLMLLHRHEQALVTLALDPLARAPAPPDDLAFAPPAERSKPERVKTSARSQAVTSNAPQCNSCGGKLPAGRTVKFCPHCGTSQAFTHCPRCNTQLEPGWKHCVTCGTAVGSG